MTHLSSKDDHLELIKKARRGCNDSMDSVILITKDKIPPYIYRLTLNRDLTQDILQDTLLEICQSLQSLKKIEAFWPWVYKIALRKTQSHFRKQKNLRETTLSEIDTDCPLKSLNATQTSGPEKIAERELRKAIWDSIKELNLKQRNVLVLRCFDQKSYSEIAEIMDCSGTTAKMNLFRARQHLKKSLHRKGMAVGSLIAGLGLFGNATQSAEAANVAANASTNVTVSAASVKVGFVAAVIGNMLTKLGGIITALLATSAIATGAVFIHQTDMSNDYSDSNSPRRNEVRSFHYYEQAFDATKNVNAINRNLASGMSLSKGAYEQLFFFPEDVDGPLFFMMQRWNPSKENKLCGWMQNGEANYYYESHSQTIYLYDYNLPIRDLSTRRLPCDTLEFTAFLDEMEGETKGVTTDRDSKTGLLVGIMDDRFYNAKDFKSKITYNSFEKKDFDNFRYPWPDDAAIVDERDAMHKRGWTYVHISGTIGSDKISGIAQVPFTYNKSLERRPWLKLDIGDNGLEIVDSDFGANIINDSKIVRSYSPGNFFMGMARPWFGMHTVDIIRRDAVAKRVKFTTEEIDDTAVKVTLTLNAADGQEYQLVYLINIECDLVEEIGIFSDSSRKGIIKFNYMDDVDDVIDLFEAPQQQRIPRKAKNKSTGLLWLLELADGSLGQ